MISTIKALISIYLKANPHLEGEKLYLYDVTDYKHFKDMDEKIIPSNWMDEDFRFFEDFKTIFDSELVLSTQCLPIHTILEV